MFKGIAARWIVLVTVILLIILIPFLLFGEQVESWTEQFLESAADKSGLIALVLGGLLAFDILLPVPSSLVMTACGFFLGFWKGLLIAFTANTISVIIGYWLGVKAGRPIANKWVGADELDNLENLYQRIGDWVIVISRAVPVMAEASVLFAGMSRMPFIRFLLLTSLSNFALSVVYVAVGTFSANVNSFLLAFFGAVLLPGIAMLIAKYSPSRQIQPSKIETE